MENRFSRTEILIGKEKMDKLKNARVAVFGVGGVGGYVVEALARSGVRSFVIFWLTPEGERLRRHLRKSTGRRAFVRSWRR